MALRPDAPFEKPTYCINGMLDSMLDAREKTEQLQRFGKRVHIPETVPPAFIHHEYLRHRDGVRPEQAQLPMEKIQQGMHTTRFHKGFTRRARRDMDIDPTEDCYRTHRTAKTAAHANARTERLGDIGAITQPFDVITGCPKRTYGASAADHVRRITTAAPAMTKPRGEFQLSGELKRSSEIALRDSHYRFFAPTTTGGNLVKRQETLVTQGLTRPTHSSVLGWGRVDLPSNGVHDNFGFANYGDAKYRPTVGHSATLTRTMQNKQRDAEIAMVRNLGS